MFYIEFVELFRPVFYTCNIEGHKEKKMEIDKNGLHPNLSKVISDMLSLPTLFGIGDYFGQYGLYLQYREEPKIPTAAVTVEGGRLTFLWNREFIEKLPEKQLRFLYLHEIYHLVSNHLGRMKAGNMDQQTSNLAGDAIINVAIRDEFKKEVEWIPGIIDMPAQYKGDHILEELYEWMLQNQPPQQKPGQGQPGDGKGGKPQPGQGAAPGLEPGETLDSHKEGGDIPAEVIESLAKEISDTLKARGIGSSDLHQKLDRLSKPKENYLKKLRRAISAVKGKAGAVSTYRRSNRRGFSELKGRQRLQNEMAVVLDTSGSMWGEMNKVLSAINREGFRMLIVPVDTEVHESAVIVCETASDLKKIKPAGGGGTTIQPGIDYANKKWPGKPVVVLTDGYTDHLNFTKCPGSIVLTTSEAPGTTGKVTIIKIK
jgi:predicted metal-dependent peptidase